ncbi:MAG: hypothetical protein K2V38_17415, partial [Gemmataceae bacterium]|nr:hypothetical protein [Gemmataceae bacterium]
VLGAVLGVVLLVGAGVGLLLAFGDNKKPVAQNNPPPKAATEPDKPQPKPQPKDEQKPPVPVTPGEKPIEPVVEPVVEPPVKLPNGGPKPGEDVFARAATFKPDGPLPELPPLPPIDRRPLLCLDPGGHSAFVRFVGFTPDGSKVISVSEDKSVRVWDVASGEAIYTVRLPAGPDDEGKPYAAALSPDGKLLAVGGFPLNAGKSGIPFYLLSLETGALVATVPGAKEVVGALDFSPDGNLLAVGCMNGVMQVYDLAGKRWVYQVLAHNTGVKQVRFHPKRAALASLGADREVKTWALADATKFVTKTNLDAQKPNAIDWTPDGDTLAVGCTNGEVRMYDLAGKPTQTIPPILENGKDPIQVARMRFLPNGKDLVFGGVAGAGWAGITDVTTGKRPVVVKEHTNSVTVVGCSADGTLAVSAGGEANEILVWSTKDGAVLRKFQSASKGLWAVGWAKDGKSLAWGTTNRSGPDGLHAIEQTFRLDDFLPGDPPEPGAFARHNRADGGLSVKVESFFEFTVSENGKPLYRHKSLSDRIYSVSILPGKGIVV